MFILVPLQDDKPKLSEIKEEKEEEAMEVKEEAKEEEEDDGVDPLDAFMQGVQEEVRKIKQDDRQRTGGAAPSTAVKEEKKVELKGVRIYPTII